MVIGGRGVEMGWVVDIAVVVALLWGSPGCWWSC